MKELLKLMAQKGKQEMNPMHKEARMSMLNALKDAMDSDMGEHLKGYKKVSVAAPDDSGLEHGLDKAKELLHEHQHEADDELEGDPIERMDHSTVEDDNSKQMDDAQDEHLKEEGGESEEAPHEAIMKHLDGLHSEHLDAAIKHLQAKKMMHKG